MKTCLECRTPAICEFVYERCIAVEIENRQVPTKQEAKESELTRSSAETSSGEDTGGKR